MGTRYRYPLPQLRIQSVLPALLALFQIMVNHVSAVVPDIMFLRMDPLDFAQRTHALSVQLMRITMLQLRASAALLDREDFTFL